jgi:hypothetical protein
MHWILNRFCGITFSMLRIIGLTLLISVFALRIFWMDTGDDDYLATGPATGEIDCC